MLVFSEKVEMEHLNNPEEEEKQSSAEETTIIKPKREDEDVPSPTLQERSQLKPFNQPNTMQTLTMQIPDVTSEISPKLATNRIKYHLPSNLE